MSSTGTVGNTVEEEEDVETGDAIVDCRTQTEDLCERADEEKTVGEVHEK